MAKVALLVDFSIRTRVIVDIPDHLVDRADDNAITRLQVAEAAKAKLEGRIAEGDSPFIPDNLEDIRFDTECPYGSLDTDETDTKNQKAPASKYGLNVVYGERASRFRGENSFDEKVHAIDQGEIDGSALKYTFETKKDLETAAEMLNDASGWLENFWELEK